MSSLVQSTFACGSIYSSVQPGPLVPGFLYRLRVGVLDFGSAERWPVVSCIIYNSVGGLPKPLFNAATWVSVDTSNIYRFLLLGVHPLILS